MKGINRENLLINSGTAATSRLQWYIISAHRPFKLSTQPPLSSLYYSLTNGQKWPVETVIAVYTRAICCICRSRIFARLFTWFECLKITTFTPMRNCHFFRILGTLSKIDFHCPISIYWMFKKTIWISKFSLYAFFISKRYTNIN